LVIYTSKCRNKARDSIKDNARPAIIGIGCSNAYYCLAYGYSWRVKTWRGHNLDTDRFFRCNMRWTRGSWRKAKIWYGAKALLYNP